MPAAGVVIIIAVVLIVLALVYYLVSTIVALRQITAGLDEAIAGVGEIIEKSAPVAEVVKDINGNLDAGVDLLEGLLVKKAGLVDAMGLVEGLYPGAAAEGLRNFPDSKTVTPPRISEVYTKGTLTLARLGREAPIAAASPNGPVLRNVEGGSLDARSLYPETRQTRPGEAAALAGHRHRRTGAVSSRASSAAGRRPDEAEIREKGPWAETAAEGIVPAELGGSDAPREMLAEDPQLGSPVLGETTGSDEPATESGIDPSAGDEADATSDGPEPPEGAEPDLKDAPAPRRSTPTRPTPERLRHVTTGETRADPRALRLRACHQRRGRHRGAAAPRLRGADHRRRAQPAADDEAPPREPRAPDRHQRPPRARPTSARRATSSGSGRSRATWSS